MSENGTQIDFLRETEAIRDQITAWRRDLHRFPELDLKLPQTRKYVTDVLSSLGVPYQTFEGHDGIVALRCLGIAQAGFIGDQIHAVTHAVAGIVSRQGDTVAHIPHAQQ